MAESVRLFLFSPDRDVFSRCPQSSHAFSLARPYGVRCVAHQRSTTASSEPVCQRFFSFRVGNLPQDPRKRLSNLRFQRWCISLAFPSPDGGLLSDFVTGRSLPTEVWVGYATPDRKKSPYPTSSFANLKALEC